MGVVFFIIDCFVFCLFSIGVFFFFFFFFAFVCTLLFFQIWSVFKSVKSDLNINVM